MMPFYGPNVSRSFNDVKSFINSTVYKSNSYIFLKDNFNYYKGSGIPLNERLDQIANHGHSSLATIRKFSENTMILNCVEGDTVLEIAASARTIKYSINNWFTSRPICEESLFPADRMKAIMARERPNIGPHEHTNTLGYNEREVPVHDDRELQEFPAYCFCKGLCGHMTSIANNRIPNHLFRTILYSVDTIYYTFQYYIQYLLEYEHNNANYIMYSSMHLPICSGNFYGNEGVFKYFCKEVSKCVRLPKPYLSQDRTRLYLVCRYNILGTMEMQVKGNSNRIYNNEVIVDANQNSTVFNLYYIETTPLILDVFDQTMVNYNHFINGMVNLPDENLNIDHVFNTHLQNEVLLRGINVNLQPEDDIFVQLYHALNNPIEFVHNELYSGYDQETITFNPLFQVCTGPTYYGTYSLTVGLNRKIANPDYLKNIENYKNNTIFYNLELNNKPLIETIQDESIKKIGEKISTTDYSLVKNPESFNLTPGNYKVGTETPLYITVTEDKCPVTCTDKKMVIGVHTLNSIINSLTQLLTNTRADLILSTPTKMYTTIYSRVVAHLPPTADINIVSFLTKTVLRRMEAIQSDLRNHFTYDYLDRFKLSLTAVDYNFLPVWLIILTLLFTTGWSYNWSYQYYLIAFLFSLGYKFCFGNY